MFGAIEAGGTKFVCAVGTGPEDIKTTQIPTTTPEETLEIAVGFFHKAKAPIQAIGIGSFGPIDLHLESPAFGTITSTPKPGWRNYNIAGAMAARLGIPVGFDTDVNAAAIGERRWGAAVGMRDFVYLTVGTGIGGGAVVGGNVLHGMVHPEMGHIRIPHDRVRDPFAGICPFHGDCLEGLASGPAIQARWEIVPDNLPEGHEAWALEAHYLALGLVSWICTLSPGRIIMGGGVMQQRHLLPMIRRELLELLNGYIQARDLIDNIDDYVVRPKLGNLSGILGGLVLAEAAATREQASSSNPGVRTSHQEEP